MNKSIDISINVLAPLAIGILLYVNRLPHIIRNYLPDGLWAYALTSSILIIWNRKINRLWIGILGVSFILFEYGQWIKVFPGTGDIIDILVYLIFSSVALIMNRLYNTKTI